jgi:hypothetical protein
VLEKDGIQFYEFSAPDAVDMPKRVSDPSYRAAAVEAQNSVWSGLSALFTCCDSFPGALPQAGIERAFGAQKPDFKAAKAPKARTKPA